MPFTKEQFLEVFVNYNTYVWPMQIILNVLALTAIYFCFSKAKNANIYIGIILTFFWLWIGVVYHLIFFSTINKEAYLFGALFIIQSGLIFYTAVIKNTLSFCFKVDKYSVWGIILLSYALVIYPVLGHLLGHAYPQSPTFGLPCPTTIFTFGLLLWTDKPVSKYLLIIPFIWSLFGFSAALNLGILEDTGLLISGITVVLLLIIRDRKLIKSPKLT
jgi:hypothetical protein